MSSFSHIAILGRQPELGLVELESLLGAENIEPYGAGSVLLREAIDVDRLGGSVKIAEVVHTTAAEPVENVLTRDFVFELLKERARDGKFVFGFSVYGKRVDAIALRKAGTAVKRRLAAVGGSVRYVAPKSSDAALTAAQLKFNHVIERGCELLVVYAGSRMAIATTTGVQNIDWYSQRDYGRPVRSAKVGMLPPKLAQILVNTTQSMSVADPFCGTGVILQEALLAGRSAVGSDLSKDMVTASKENLTWLGTQVPTSLPHWEVKQADARDLKLSADCAVVSEGYLGTHLDHSPADAELAKLRQELTELYRAALANFGRQQAHGAEIAICAPAWRVKGQWHYLGIVDELPRLGYTLKRFKHVRTPLLYARGDQIVGRQLLLLRKN